MDHVKQHLRPIVAGVLFYLVIKYSPLWGVVAGLVLSVTGGGGVSHALIFFVTAFLLYLPVPLIAGGKRQGFFAAMAAVAAINVGNVYFLLMGSAPSLVWLSVAAGFLGVYLSNMLLGELFGGESDAKLSESIKKGESPLYKRSCKVVSCETRDESSSSVTSHTTNEVIYVGDTSAVVPRTVYNVSRNTRVVQDVWVKGEDGKEKKVRLVNRDLDIKEGQDIDLVYTLNGDLEYIKNHSTGQTTRLFNYVFDYSVLNTAKDLWASFLGMMMLCFPFVGALMAVFSITTGYSYINKPLRRSYLGKSLLVSSIFTAVVSLLFTRLVWVQISTPGFSFDIILRGYIVSVVLVFSVRVVANYLVSRKAKKMERLLLSHV